MIKLFNTYFVRVDRRFESKPWREQTDQDQRTESVCAVQEEQ